MANNQPPFGDDCPFCGAGNLVVYSGHTLGTLHLRYLRCWACKAAPPNNKVTITWTGDATE